MKKGPKYPKLIPDKIEVAQEELLKHLPRLKTAILKIPGKDRLPLHNGMLLLANIILDRDEAILIDQIKAIEFEAKHFH